MAAGVYITALYPLVLFLHSEGQETSQRNEKKVQRIPTIPGLGPPEACLGPLYVPRPRVQVI